MATKLGLNDNMVENIKRNEKSEEERAHAVLIKWKRFSEEEVTWEMLKKVLKTIRCHEVIRIVNNEIEK